MDQEKLNDLLRDLHETTGSRVMLLMPDREVVTYPGTPVEFYRMLRASQAEPTEANGEPCGEKPLRQQIMDYICNNLSQDLSVQALCRRFAVSKSELYRLVRSQAPEGIARYVRQLRFRKACELLRGTNMPIWQIAEEVGYDNPDYFLRVFKKETGTSAGKYRKHTEEP